MSKSFASLNLDNQPAFTMFIGAHEIRGYPIELCWRRMIVKEC